MRRILVIDDDPDILTVMKLVLKLKGYEVLALDKGSLFWDAVSTFKPHLALLDVLISGYDGRLLCKSLKSDPKWKHLPVIMFSAHPTAGETINEYGADGFVSKPFDMPGLVNLIGALVLKGD